MEFFLSGISQYNFQAETYPKNFKDKSGYPGISRLIPRSRDIPGYPDLSRLIPWVQFSRWEECRGILVKPGLGSAAQISSGPGASKGPVKHTLILSPLKGKSGVAMMSKPMVEVKMRT